MSRSTYRCESRRPVFSGLLATSLTLCAAYFGNSSSASADTIVLDFEDLSPTGGPFQPMPTGYGGIEWSDIYWPYDEAQDPFNPSSGIVRIAGNRVPRADDPIPRGQLQFVTPDQVFIGAWFAGPSPPQVVEVQFQLFNDGVLVHTSATLQMSPVPTFLASGYDGPVDAVTIVGPEGEFVFDDLSYSTMSAGDIEVDIDIRPFTSPNRVNPNSTGNLWVAIMSDTSVATPFDPTSQVDMSSVEFGPLGAKPMRHRARDINGDGLGDLLLKFRIPETGIACGDTEATLTGETFDGLAIVGSDAVTTVRCRRQDGR